MYDAASGKQHPRFYCPQLPIALGSSIELEEEEARHAVRVLRLKHGDHVELCDGKGGVTLCEVAHTGRNSATVSVRSAADMYCKYMLPRLLAWRWRCCLLCTFQYRSSQRHRIAA